MAPFSVIVFGVVVWTIAVSGAKQLRFRLKTDSVDGAYYDTDQVEVIWEQDCRQKKKNSNMKEKISCEMILSQYCFCTFMTSSAVLRKEDIYTTQLYLYSFTILQLLASIFILNTFL